MCRLGVGQSEHNEKSIPERGISKNSKGLEEEMVNRLG